MSLVSPKCGQLRLEMHLLRLELSLLGVQARELATLGRDPRHEDDDGHDERAECSQDGDTVAGELFHHDSTFLVRLASAVSHKVDWKATVVFAPVGALVTEATPGGLNIEEAVRSSIHCATGSKCAELGNAPETPRASEPMAPSRRYASRVRCRCSRRCRHRSAGRGRAGAGECGYGQPRRDPLLQLRYDSRPVHGRRRDLRDLTLGDSKLVGDGDHLVECRDLRIELCHAGPQVADIALRAVNLQKAVCAAAYEDQRHDSRGHEGFTDHAALESTLRHLGGHKIELLDRGIRLGQRQTDGRRQHGVDAGGLLGIEVDPRKVEAGQW